MSKNESAENLWRKREQIRVDSGAYKKVEAFIPGRVPLEDIISTIYPDHFLHISTGNKQMIAYTPDDDYGIRDRKVESKIGRYLHRFFEEQLTPDCIRDYSAAHRFSIDNNGLSLACTPDEIAWVYENGPSSCMQGKPWTGHCGQHPARLYGMSIGGTVAVAYMHRGTKVTARCVVNIKDKKYYKIYGDSVVLSIVLKKEGYRATSGALNGARFPMVPLALNLTGSKKNTFLMPYMDGSNQRVKVEEQEDGTKIFVVHSQGKYLCKSTVGHGYISDEKPCGYCSSEFPEEDLNATYSGSIICNDCRDSHYTLAVVEPGGTRQLVLSCDTVYIDYKGVSYLHDPTLLEEAGLVWSEIENNWLWKSDCVKTYEADWIYITQAVSFIDGNTAKIVYMHKNEVDVHRVFIETATGKPHINVQDGLTYVPATVYIQEAVDEAMRNIDHAELFPVNGVADFIRIMRSQSPRSNTLVKNLLNFGETYEWKERKFITDYAYIRFAQEARDLQEADNAIRSAAATAANKKQISSGAKPRKRPSKRTL